jgi:hypothetical protein
MSRNLISDEQTLSHHIPDRNAGIDHSRCITASNYVAILKNEMIEREKSDCIDSLYTALAKTSRWRRKLVDQYTDPRFTRLTSGDLLF